LNWSQTFSKVQSICSPQSGRLTWAERYYKIWQKNRSHGSCHDEIDNVRIEELWIYITIYLAQRPYKIILRWWKRLIINHSRIINLLVPHQRHEIPTGHKSESWKTLIHIIHARNIPSDLRMNVNPNQK
jgi:hypothetical protein